MKNSLLVSFLTFPETNISPEKQLLESVVSFLGRPIFRRYVIFKECIIFEISHRIIVGSRKYEYDSMRSQSG